MTRSSFTVRCGAENCWFVGHGSSVEDCQTVLNGHECPTPPYRNELPTGRSTLEKTWDELDDVTDCIAEKRPYHSSSGIMSGDMLIGYARGIAFTLTMMTHPHFRTTKEIAAEVRARRMMRIGKMEYRPPPGYNFNPMPRTDPSIVRTIPAEKKAPVKQASKPASRSVPPKFPPIPADKAAPIRMMLEHNIMSVEDIARLHNYHPSQVRALQEG